MYRIYDCSNAMRHKGSAVVYAHESLVVCISHITTMHLGADWRIHVVDMSTVDFFWVGGCYCIQHHPKGWDNVETSV